MRKIINTINNELNRKIAKINSRDAGYFSKAQKILSRLDEIKREYQSSFTRISSEFTTINATIQVLVTNMVQHNVDSTLGQRTQSVSDESDQQSESEASNRSRGNGALHLEILVHQPINRFIS